MATVGQLRMLYYCFLSFDEDDFDSVSPFLPALETFHVRFTQFLTLDAYTYPFILPLILAPVDTKAIVTPQPLDLCQFDWSPSVNFGHSAEQATQAADSQLSDIDF